LASCLFSMPPCFTSYWTRLNTSTKGCRKP
jgi:hypothetical protein